MNTAWKAWDLQDKTMAIHPEDAWKYIQWELVAVTNPATTYEISFSTASGQYYDAWIYCRSIKQDFYTHTEPKQFQATDNDGKMIQITITYSIQLDDLVNNDVINQLMCKLV